MVYMLMRGRRGARQLETGNKTKVSRNIQGRSGVGLFSSASSSLRPSWGGTVTLVHFHSGPLEHSPTGLRRTAGVFAM